MQAEDVKVNPMLLFKHGLLGVILLLKTVVVRWGSYPIIQSKSLRYHHARTRSLCLQPAVKVLVIAHEAQTNPNRPLFTSAKKLPNSWCFDTDMEDHAGLEINL